MGLENRFGAGGWRAGGSRGVWAPSPAHSDWAQALLLPHLFQFTHCSPGQGVTLEGNGTGLLQLELGAMDLSSFQIDAGTPGGTVALPLGLCGHATGRLGARSLATPGLWKDQPRPGAPRPALSRQLGADVTRGPECSGREKGRGRGWLVAVPAPDQSCTAPQDQPSCAACIGVAHAMARAREGSVSAGAGTERPVRRGLEDACLSPSPILTSLGEYMAEAGCRMGWGMASREA